MTTGYLSIAAAAFIAGAILSLCIDKIFIIPSVVIFIILCIIISIIKRKSFVYKIILALLFICGMVLTQNYSDTDKNALSIYENLYVSVNGIISELPKKSGDNIRYVIETQSVIKDGKELKIKERLLVTAKESFSFGESITVQGFIKSLPEKMSEYGFDLKRHYMSKDIFFKLYSQKSQLYEKPFKNYSIYFLSNSFKYNISKIIDRYTENNQSAILKAILTGNRNDFSEDFDEVLSKTGTKRFFYPAYIHISIIICSIGLFSSIICKKKRDIITIIILTIYIIAQSSHPNFIKCSLVVIITIIFCRWQGFSYFPDVIGVMILIVGFVNPLILFDACFVSSTAASILIKFFYDPLSSFLSFIKGTFIRKSIIAGIICNIGLFPLTAFYFNGITPYTIVTSLVFLPVTIVILLIAPLFLIMLVLWGCAPVVSQLMNFLVWIYMKIPYFIEILPLSYIGLPKPSVLSVLAFYIFLYAVWLKFMKSTSVFYIMIVFAAFLTVILSLQAARLNTMEITFVNVNQGDGAVIDMPYRNTVIIDGGGGVDFNDDYNPGESMFLPFLQRKGISEIDCAIVSHSHKDHIEGVIAAMEELRVKHLYLPKPITEIKYYNRLIITAKTMGTEVHIVEEDTTLNFNSGLTIEITAPINTLSTKDDNDTSLLVRAAFGNISSTFTGDMTKLSEYRLLNNDKVKPSQILKVSHHGSDTSNSDEFIRAVSPSIAVISAGQDNVFGLPHRNVLKKFSDIKLLRTDLNGDITITATKNNIRNIKTFK